MLRRFSTTALAFRYALLLCTTCLPTGEIASQSARSIEQGGSWQQVTDPEVMGYSRTRLDSALTVVKGMKTSAFLVTVGGRALLQYGDLADTSYIASARKSVLSMLYGKYVENGTIRLTETLAELGLDDLGGLLPVERTATVEHLLGARSGVYHAASNPGDALQMAPVRGSQKPGTYNLYSNWDFNALGTIFEKKTGRGIYDAFDADIARPIGMQDFHRAVHSRQGDTTRSIHKAYHFVLSTRDMARLGHLMLRNGKWGSQQVIPASWVRRSTHLVTPPAEMNPPGIRAQALALGQGYSFLWWNRVRPDTTDALHGAYAAEGAFGQYILVIPKLDMVVAHKVVARGGPTENSSVTLPQFEELVRTVVSARCVAVAPGSKPASASSAPQQRGASTRCHFASPPFSEQWTTPAPAPGTHRAAPAAGMVGEYEAAPGNSVKVTLENGHIHVEHPGAAKQRLMHVAGETFAVTADSSRTFTFSVGANGRATALTLRENGKDSALPRVK